MNEDKTQAGQTVPLNSLVRPNIRETEDFERSCDQCDCQEDGGHYCLLHGVQMKNMNIMTCDDWEEKKSNAQISGGTLSAESDCSVLRKRIADLEEGLRKIAVWTQEDQDDHDICVLQWRGCVAIARELLKPNAGSDASASSPIASTGLVGREE